jgi:hypothetical protein
MKYILSLIISGALVVSGFGQTRNVLVGTNNAVVQPTNFWSADASNARTGLGLGTAATSSVSAFQPASTALSNLATGNGGALSNLQATNLVGIIPASNISTVTFTNIGGTLAISSGGTGATNAVNARQNLGSTIVGDAVFIATNAAAARTAIGALATDGNAINLTNFPTILLQTNGNGAGLTNLTAANITGTVALASNLSSPLSLTNGGTGATNAAIARTNLELGWSALTNTDATNFRNAIGLGTTNNVVFNAIVGGASTNNFIQLDNGEFNGSWSFVSAVDFDEPAQTRTNLGIPWSGLTNTNAATFQSALFGSNTNPVLVNTNGEVVSPTNFWQAAPITTTFIESQPNTNFTTNITPARFLHIHSLATNIANVTNTIVLPTNTLTFEGDVAIVVHKGPTNSMTRVQRVGSTNNLITLTRFDEAVQFVYYNDVWQFDHNVAFVEPIYFSGTNAAANAAASRTNLGLAPFTSDGYAQLRNEAGDVILEVEDGVTIYREIYFEGTNASANAAITRTNLGLGATWLTNTNVTNFRSAIGLGASNQVTFEAIVGGSGSINVVNSEFFGAWYFDDSVSFGAPNVVRTNLGLPLPALTNTNNANFRNAIELGATNNVSFSNVTASGTLTATGTVTATTNLVVNGFVDFSTNHTNSNPATNNQINDFIEIRVGTNQFWLPVYK